MSQIWENRERKNFGPDFHPFWPIFGPPNFFQTFYFYQMLNAVASYHCMKFQGKLMNQTWKNSKKLAFKPDFDPFLPKYGPNIFSFFFFLWLSPLLNVMHCCKLSMYTISRKINESNWENEKKPLVLGSIFAPLAQI